MTSPREIIARCDEGLAKLHVALGTGTRGVNAIRRRIADLERIRTKAEAKDKEAARVFTRDPWKLP